MNKRDLSDNEDGDEVVPATQHPCKKKRFRKKSENFDTNNVKKMDNFDDLFLDDDFDDFNLDLQSNEPKYELDLSSWKRCVVKSVTPEGRNLILVVEEQDTNLMGKCRLESPWNQTKIQENSVVSLHGTFDNKSNLHVISSESGLFVISPDFLIPGTTVVGALYCRRRGVLADKFKGVDCDNKIMTIGTIIHEVLQNVLKLKIRKYEDIKKSAKNLVDSPQMLNLLYSSQMSKEDAEKEIELFLPKIANFVRNHVMDTEKSRLYTDIQIDSIEDIEENVWCPQLGLKGKIDASVRARNKEGAFEMMPLELKTGRASFSAEHTGQLVLYEMMMNLVGHKVTTGLLLYLREEQMRPIASSRPMKRDLIMLRNEVAHYLSKGLSDTALESFNIENNIPELPEPINNHMACSKCPYNIICATYLKKENMQLPQNHSMKVILNEGLLHLTNIHIDYFIRWTGLMYLEMEESKKSFQLKSIWTQKPEMRAKHGNAMINLSITGTVAYLNDAFIHSFTVENAFDQSKSLEMFDTDVTNQVQAKNIFEIGEYIIVSTNTRIAVAAGKIIDIAKRCITVGLERNLSKIYPGEIFNLDKYESQMMMNFNFTNLGVLLDDSERSDRLRRIIIDKIQPNYSKNVPVIVAKVSDKILSGLNKNQRTAILMAISTDSYCLFKGLPGTGKTQTVSALVRLLVAMGKSVLITSHTHSAVDNVLKRLVTHNVEFIRLGSTNRIDQALEKYSEATVTADCKTPSDLSNIYNKYQVVGVTCLGAAHPLLAQKSFDYCIIDEATQVFQSAAIRPMLFAQKYVLIGDPAQLPPVIKSKKAKDLGADESLFKRLDSEKATFVLPLQYRMNKCITKLANNLSYKGELKCANDSVSQSVLQIKTLKKVVEKHSSEKWLIRVISPQLEMSVVLIDTLNTFEKSIEYAAKNSNSILSQTIQDSKNDAPKALYSNYCEAALTFYILSVLMEGSVKGSSIGIIAPFRAQVEVLRNYLNLFKIFKKQSRDCEDLDVEVNTVDQYQGKDKDVIIYSCTRSNNPNFPPETTSSEYEILEDRRRLTVAITRAKNKLIIIGDVDSLNKYTPLNDLFKNIPSFAKVKLADGVSGFDWTGTFTVLNNLHDCEN